MTPKEEKSAVRPAGKRYGFSMQGVTCRSAAPSVAVVPRDEDGLEPLILPAQGEFRRLPGFLATPAGRVSLNELDWTHPDGCRVVFTLGEFVDQQGLLLKARLHNGTGREAAQILQGESDPRDGRDGMCF